MLSEFVAAAQANLVIATDSVPNILIPAANECILFPDQNFSGIPFSLAGAGTYDIKAMGFNNLFDSWSCGANVFAYFCDSV